ncbi:MAG: response regulator, partial [Porphyromonas sp.]|nr:response regulator [Porphyromonas sp.]
MKKIMLIDDIITYGYDLKEKLEGYGYEVYYSPTAVGIVDFINDFGPNLLFLDIELNENKNGIEVCREVSHLFPKLPIIIISSFAGQEIKTEAITAGALSYVEKPLTAQLLDAYIKRYSSSVTVRPKQKKEIMIDVAQQLIYFSDGSIVGISPTQTRILEILEENERTNVRFEEIKHYLWKGHNLPENSDAIIYNEVSRIRRIINKYTKNSFLRSIHGVGYRFING